MDQPLEHRCATCAVLMADSYGKCDHTQCLACLADDLAHKEILANWHEWQRGNLWLEPSY